MKSRIVNGLKQSGEERIVREFLTGLLHSFAFAKLSETLRKVLSWHSPRISTPLHSRVEATNLIAFLFFISVLPFWVFRLIPSVHESIVIASFALVSFGTYFLNYFGFWNLSRFYLIMGINAMISAAAWMERPASGIELNLFESVILSYVVFRRSEKSKLFISIGISAALLLFFQLTFPSELQAEMLSRIKIYSTTIFLIMITAVLYYLARMYDDSRKGMQRASDFLHQILEASGSPLFVRDSQLRVVMANQAYCSFIGRSLDEILGKDNKELFGHELGEMFRGVEEFVLRTGEEISSEENYPDGNGKNHVIVTKRTKYTDSSGSEFIIGSLTDITDIRNNEEIVYARLRYETAVAACSKVLARYDHSLLENVEAALSYLREAIQASRSYFLEAHQGETGELVLKLAREVCAEGIPSRMNNPLLQELPYSSLPNKLTDAIARQSYVTFLTRESAAPWQEGFQNEGITSILHLPIYSNGKFIGLVSFQDSKSEKAWQEQDIMILQTAAEMIGNAIERYNSEKELKESEERFRSLIADVNIGVIVYGPTGAPILCNSAALSLLGLTESQLFERDSTIPIEWNAITEDGNLLSEDFASVNECILKRISRRNTVIGIFSPRRPERYWLLVNTEVSISEDGSVSQVVVSLIDITHRKQAEEQFRLLSKTTSASFGTEYFASAVQSLSHLLRANSVFVAELVSYDTLKILSFWDNDRFGKSDLYYNLEGSGFGTLLRREESVVVSQGFAVEYVLDGFLEERRFESYIGIPLFNSSNDYIGVIVVLDTKPLRSDPERFGDILQILASRTGAEVERKKSLEKITEYSQAMEKQNLILTRAVEAAEQANKAKTAFLSSVSHELRTPLNAIIGFSNILMNASEMKTEWKEYSRSMYRSGKHLLEMINDILDISKIEAGAFELDESDFEISEMLADLKLMFRVQTIQKGLELHFLLDKKVPHVLKGDSKRIRQVLINLVANAVKFTHAGSVRLEISVEEPPMKLDPDYVFLFFSVKDTGPGIPEEDKRNIFEPFVQGDQQFAGGTGLGLTITDRIVRSMGGQVDVETQLGKGTEFSFHLLLKKGDTEGWKSQKAGNKANQLYGLSEPSIRNLGILLEEADEIGLPEALFQSIGFRTETKLLVDWSSEWKRPPELFFISLNQKISDLPSGFQAFLEKNRSRIIFSGIVRYFVRKTEIDLDTLVSFVNLIPGVYFQTALTPVLDDSEEEMFDRLVACLLALPEEMMESLLAAIEVQDFSELLHIVQHELANRWVHEKELYSLMKTETEKENLEFLMKLSQRLEQFNANLSNNEAEGELK